MRPGAVAGVAGQRQSTAYRYPLTFPNADRALLQVQVNTHGPVIVQHPHEIAGSVGAAPALPVLGFHHHPASRGNDRRALRHCDVYGISALGPEVAVGAIGALTDPEWSTTPGQRVPIAHRGPRGVAQGVFELRDVCEGPPAFSRREPRQTNAAA
ncbi:hypothetical protein D3C72_1577550 [compost metagenome]